MRAYGIFIWSLLIYASFLILVFVSGRLEEKREEGRAYQERIALIQRYANGTASPAEMEHKRRQMVLLEQMHAEEDREMNEILKGE
jgi:hypothetical protein